MCLLDNREVRKGWESLKGSVAAVFTKHNAKVLSSRRWDERRLTYPINGQIRATYLLLYMSIETDEIPVLRRDLQFSDSVLRYMITDCAELPADAHEPETEFDVNAIPEDDAPEPEPTKPGAKDGAAKDGAAKDGAAKGGDAKEGDAKAAEAKDGDAKAADAKDGDAKDGDAKAADAKDGDAKAAEAKAADAKDGDAAGSPAAADGEEKK
jgi:ribosomal protein S6